ncbi:MAG: DUF1269 domain-containing protein [Ilumatobacteraceae bacterium]
MGVPGDDRDDRDGAAETADWSPPSLEGRPADDRFDDTRPIEYLDTDQALIGVSFDDQFRAQEFLTAMTRLASVQSLRLRDAVVVSKDATGDVRVRETIDPQPARTAATGAIWSGLLGLMIGGPVGWLAGIGIGPGAITAKLVDLGIPDEWVEWFRAAVRDGTTSVVILAEDLDMRALEAEARRFAGAELVHATLPASAIELLRAALDGRGP